MVRHLIIAAWRNMMANRLQTAISIFGLSIGIAAVLLMALIIRNQLTFDDFLPDQDRTYVVVTPWKLSDEPGTPGTASDSHLAELLRLNIPQIESVTRISGGSVKLKSDQVTAKDRIVWADPNMFQVLKFPVLHGDLSTALSYPDGVVLPRTFAEKYFGRDDVVGQAIEIDGRPMTVRAVIEDLPKNATRFENHPYVSSLAPFSFFAKDKLTKGRVDFGTETYVRLKPGASVTEVEKPMRNLIDSLDHDALGGSARLMRLDRTHIEVDASSESRAKLAVGSAIGILILFIAAANFVNLMVARAARREREVGVRKVCGASRLNLALQFQGEAMIATIIAALIAVALCEWLLPLADTYLQVDAKFDFSQDLLLVPAFVLGVAIVGMGSGAYPALVLSALRPATTLRGWTSAARNTGFIRNALVMLQFSILVVLIIASDVIYRQHNYVVREALRINIDQLLVVKNACYEGFRDKLREIPGVKAVSCAGDEFLDGVMVQANPYRGRIVLLTNARVDRSLFGLYGQWPIAGTLSGNASASNDDLAQGLIINMAAVKRLGFLSPKAAIGQAIWQLEPWSNLRIVAVVPDFSLNNFDNKPISPTVYTKFGDGFAPPTENSMLHIRLDGQRIPESVAAIDQLWKTTGGEGPIDSFFLDAHMQERYVDLLHQAELFTIFSAIAMFLACLGLFGIAASTAERRIKEVGIRKAMGATSAEILTLLMFEFSKPVVWATLIAWPLAWWLMRRWLASFAFHVDLQPSLFPIASAIALLVALLTVAGQALLIARQKPILALRYE